MNKIASPRIFSSRNSGKSSHSNPNNQKPPLPSSNSDEPPEPKERFRFRLLTIGLDSGKSSLIYRYLKDKFVQVSDPTLEDNYTTKWRKHPQLKGDWVTLEIKDVSGHPDHSHFFNSWYSWADAFLCVYDICHPNSFYILNDYLEKIRQYKHISKIPMTLIGSKTDLINTNPELREVDTSLAEALAEANDCQLFEVSSRTGENVHPSIDYLVYRLLSDALEKEKASFLKHSDSKGVLKTLKQFRTPRGSRSHKTHSEDDSSIPTHNTFEDFGVVTKHRTEPTSIFSHPTDTNSPISIKPLNLTPINISTSSEVPEEISGYVSPLPKVTLVDVLHDGDGDDPNKKSDNKKHTKLSRKGSKKKSRKKLGLSRSMSATFGGKRSKSIESIPEASPPLSRQTTTPVPQLSRSNTQEIEIPLSPKVVPMETTFVDKDNVYAPSVQFLEQGPKSSEAMPAELKAMLGSTSTSLPVASSSPVDDKPDESPPSMKSPNLIKGNRPRSRSKIGISRIRTLSMGGRTSTSPPSSSPIASGLPAGIDLSDPEALKKFMMAQKAGGSPPDASNETSYSHLPKSQIFEIPLKLASERSMTRSRHPFSYPAKKPEPGEEEEEEPQQTSKALKRLGIVLSKPKWNPKLDRYLDESLYTTVPILVLDSLRYLKRTDAINEEGIFRLSGKATEYQRLKSRYNESPEPIDLRQIKDPNIIAGLLKLYLRELPDNLLSSQLDKFRDLNSNVASAEASFSTSHSVDDFHTDMDMSSTIFSKFVKSMTDILNQLPKCNLETLVVLFAYLYECSMAATVNKMRTSNIVVVFAPTLRVPREMLGFLIDFYPIIFKSFIIPESCGITLNKLLYPEKILENTEPDVVVVEVSSPESESEKGKDSSDSSPPSPSEKPQPTTKAVKPVKKKRRPLPPKAKAVVNANATTFTSKRLYT